MNQRDAYFPHAFTEVPVLVSGRVVAWLDLERSCGIAWYGRHDRKVLRRKRRPDGTYRDRRQHTIKPR